MSFINATGILQLDFQVNRVLTYGDKAGIKAEILNAVKGVTDFLEWFDAWYAIAQVAEKEKRFLHAAYYYRMAEFFLADKDKRKKEMLELSISNYQKIIEQDDAVKMLAVPYQDKVLRTLVFSPKNEKDTLVLFGGYDSFIEEFYLTMKGFTEKGYKVILFEGPGQGLSLKKGLYFEPKWEKPVSAVLDYFELKTATLVGISWGGYLGLRAAAMDKRIKKVVAYDILYDGFDCMLSQFPPIAKALFKSLFFLKQKRIINALLESFKKKKLVVDWAISHGQYISGTESPYDFYMHLKEHTLAGITDKITAEVLLLAGEKDHYIPLNHYHILMRELNNAKSLTGRIFTEAEGGAQHCQVGNHMLAINYIIDWLEEKR